MLYEIHMLKNYPPTNLNRDENGAPKTCTFGGVNRGRISSQCLKRTWRTSAVFQQEIGAENLGIRTRKLPELVGEKLIEMGVDPQIVELLVPKISGFGTKDGAENKKSNMTAQVIFFGPQDIQAAAEAVKAKLDGCKSEKDVKALKGKDLQAAVEGSTSRSVTLDIALFGRMVTSDAFRDVEASMQVAHAISTNKVAMESDYFTAMDDLLNGETADESGAAMIGDIDYNSSCYYLYAALDTDIFAGEPAGCGQCRGDHCQGHSGIDSYHGLYQSFRQAEFLCRPRAARSNPGGVQADEDPHQYGQCVCGAGSWRRSDLLGNSIEKLAPGSGCHRPELWHAGGEAPVVLRGQVCHCTAVQCPVLQDTAGIGGGCGPDPGLRWRL